VEAPDVPGEIGCAELADAVGHVVRSVGDQRAVAADPVGELVDVVDSDDDHRRARAGRGRRPEAVGCRVEMDETLAGDDGGVLEAVVGAGHYRSWWEAEHGAEPGLRGADVVVRQQGDRLVRAVGRADGATGSPQQRRLIRGSSADDLRQRVPQRSQARQLGVEAAELVLDDLGKVPVGRGQVMGDWAPAGGSLVELRRGSGWRRAAPRQLTGGDFDAATGLAVDDPARGRRCLCETSGSAVGGERKYCNLVAVGDLGVSDDLIGLATFAGYEDQIAGGGGGECRRDCLRSIGDCPDAVTVFCRAGDDLGNDLIGILCARVVGSDDDLVGQFGCDPAHDGALGAVSVAAAAEHRQDLAGDSWPDAAGIEYDTGDNAAPVDVACD